MGYEQEEQVSVVGMRMLDDEDGLRPDRSCLDNKMC